MTIHHAAHRRPAYSVQHADRMIRLKDMSTRQYLHLSGSGTTRDIDQAWLGYIHQADTLRKRAVTRGDPWPFTKVIRRLSETTKPHVGF